MRPDGPPTDEELLASHDSEAFGVFYDRHVRALLGYFARRTRDPEVAADLTTETIASAPVAQDRYVPTEAPALAWLYTTSRLKRASRSMHTGRSHRTSRRSPPCRPARARVRL
jgi:DNA-directed RNA polymerase specialized sigma24 family protein